MRVGRSARGSGQFAGGAAGRRGRAAAGPAAAAAGGWRFADALRLGGGLVAARVADDLPGRAGVSPLKFAVVDRLVRLHRR